MSDTPIFDKRDIIFVSPRSGSQLAHLTEEAFSEHLARNGMPGLGLLLNNLLEHKMFEDGEYCPTVRDEHGNELADRDEEGHPTKFHTDMYKGKRIYVITDVSSKQDPNVLPWQLALLANAYYALGVSEVNAVLGYTYFDRQDISTRITEEDTMAAEQGVKYSELKKKGKMVGQAESLKCLIQLLHCFGYRKIITPTPHSPATRDYIEMIYRDRDVFFPIDMNPVLAHYVKFGLSKEYYLGDRGENLVLSAVDAGALARVQEFQHLTGYDKAAVIVCKKNRIRPNDPAQLESCIETSSTPLEEISLENKVILVIEDCTDTAGSIYGNKLLLCDSGLMQGKPKAFFAALSHPLLSVPGAFTELKKHGINLICTNTRSNIGEHYEGGGKAVEVLEISRYLCETVVNCAERGIRPEEHFAFSPENLETAGRLYKVVERKPKRVFVDYKPSH